MNTMKWRVFRQANKKWAVRQPGCPSTSPMLCKHQNCYTFLLWRDAVDYAALIAGNRLRGFRGAKWKQSMQKMNFALVGPAK